MHTLYKKLRLRIRIREIRDFQMLVFWITFTGLVLLLLTELFISWNQAS
jgi:hypothetical protein